MSPSPVKTGSASIPCTWAGTPGGHPEPNADTDRAAVQQAMESLPTPLGVSPVTAALMALDSYPSGKVDVVRVQRVADVMRQFLGSPVFNVGSMVGG